VITSRLGMRIGALKRGKYTARGCVSRRQAVSLYHAWVAMLDMTIALRDAGHVTAARNHAHAMRDLMKAFRNRGEQNFRATQPQQRTRRLA
jgi:hypothetical protein